MREEQIQLGLNFIKSQSVQGVPVEERAQFLEGKLTQEEISEVLKRYKAGNTSSAPAQIVNSPVT